jgi:hypothetical protein
MYNELDDKVNTFVEDYISKNCKEGDSSKTGLDKRAIGLFWYNWDCIIVPADRRRALDYYGGFEYIDSDYVKQYGEYVMYSAEADRVQEVLDSVFDSFEECADA